MVQGKMTEKTKRDTREERTRKYIKNIYAFVNETLCRRGTRIFATEGRQTLDDTLAHCSRNINEEFDFHHKARNEFAAEITYALLLERSDWKIMEYKMHAARAL